MNGYQNIMHQNVIISGFGGQGIMLIGNLLAYACMEQGFHVTYMPIYGPEMRGGTANCTVVISSEDIGSPIIKQPLSLIIMNRPSLDKFQPRLRDGGIQILNASLIEPTLAETNRISTFAIPCNEIADKLGNARMANMVALGAYIAATGILPLETVQQALPNVISSNYANIIPKNAEALSAGAGHVLKNNTLGE
ncbi:2-oxoglutarate ferredoxin oxidoreductase subunit gamma [Desulfovibrionales bacterium]